MHIVEVTWRNHNDFRFIAECRHCGMRSRHGDGYADATYQHGVFPARHCEHCGCDEYGDKPPDLDAAATPDLTSNARSGDRG